MECFQPEPAPPPTATPQRAVVVVDVTRGGPLLICWECRLRITTVAARISVGGQHQHTCMNPHGYRYIVGCFAAVVGCREIGEPSTFWSWFPGYSWQIEHCAGCNQHLGWVFRSAEQTFHGLILERLRIVDDEPTPAPP